jgi:hypothetical protein
MKTSIFGRLSSYRPREAKFAEEDFFTEVFVGVMERESQVLAGIFKWLTDRETVDVFVHTQGSFSSVLKDKGTDRPDIVMVGFDADGGEHLLFLESKLDSTEGDQQLPRYCALLRTMSADSRTLAYITKRVDEQKDIADPNVRFVQRRWADVYRYLKLSQRKTLLKTTLVQELLNFMEQTNMSAEITPGELIAGTQFANARLRFWHVLERANRDSGLSDAAKARAAGKWMSTPISDGDISYTSPAFRESHLQVVFGIHFKTTEAGTLVLTETDDGMPILFAALYRSSGAAAFEEEKKAAVDELCAKGWDRMSRLRKDSQYVVRREVLLEKIDVRNLSDFLASQMTSVLKDLVDSPLLK